jgi:hypothetical protein
MRGAGAIVFLIAFFAMLAATLAYPTIPPGPQLYNMLNVPTVNDYSVLGVPVTTLVIAIFNGVVCGIIVWLVYTGLNRAGVIK